MKHYLVTVKQLRPKELVAWMISLMIGPMAMPFTESLVRW